MKWFARYLFIIKSINSLIISQHICCQLSCSFQLKSRIPESRKVKTVFSYCTFLFEKLEPTCLHTFVWRHYDNTFNQTCFRVEFSKTMWSLLYGRICSLGQINHFLPGRPSCSISRDPFRSFSNRHLFRLHFRMHPNEHNLSCFEFVCFECLFVNKKWTRNGLDRTSAWSLDQHFWVPACIWCTEC